MSLYLTPEENEANPPHTWQVVKVADRKWALMDRQGNTLTTFPRRMDADMARQMGWWVDMWQRESDWYAGKTPPGWKPYVPVGAA